MIRFERKQEIETEISELSLSNPILPTRITAEALLELLGQGAKGTYHNKRIRRMASVFSEEPQSRLNGNIDRSL